MDNYLASFGRAWAITVGLETCVLLTLLQLRWFANRSSWAKRIAGGIFASTMTLPYLWFVAPKFLGYGLELKLFAEPLIYLVEAIFYAQYFGLDWKRAALLSTVCNTVSLVFGVLFYNLIS